MFLKKLYSHMSEQTRGKQSGAQSWHRLSRVVSHTSKTLRLKCQQRRCQTLPPPPLWLSSCRSSSFTTCQPPTGHLLDRKPTPYIRADLNFQRRRKKIKKMKGNADLWLFFSLHPPPLASEEAVRAMRETPRQYQGGSRAKNQQTCRAEQAGNSISNPS